MVECFEKLFTKKDEKLVQMNPDANELEWFAFGLEVNVFICEELLR